MANNNKTINGLETDKDDDPTSELEVLPESAGREFETDGMLDSGSDEHTTGFAGLVSQPGTADETIAALQSDLKSRAETIGKLEFELQHLKSKSTGLEKELSVLEEAMSSSAAEAKLARQNYFQTKDLLKKRDIEVESLKSQLQAKERKLDQQIEEVHTNKTQAVTEPETKQDLIGDCTDVAEEHYDLAMLVPINGDASGQCAIKTGLLRLGSGPDNDIRIESNFISRHHAEIVSNSADSILRDLNSTNGTYVNSKRIKRHALRNGDSIRVGNHRFRYVKKNLGSRDYKASTAGARMN
jgi:hypothetical protein